MYGVLPIGDGNSNSNRNNKPSQVRAAAGALKPTPRSSLVYGQGLDWKFIGSNTRTSNDLGWRASFNEQLQRRVVKRIETAYDDGITGSLNRIFDEMQQHGHVDHRLQTTDPDHYVRRDRGLTMPFIGQCCCYTCQ